MTKEHNSSSAKNNTNPKGLGCSNLDKKLSINEKTFKKLSTSTEEKLPNDKKPYQDKPYPKDKQLREQTLQVLSDAPQTDNVRFHSSIKSKETGNEIDIPIKATIGAGKEAHELDPSKTAVWALVGLGQLTPDEVEDFIKDNESKLSYNELLSIKLMKDSLEGNAKAQQIFWAVQEKIANRKAVMAQINITEVKPDATMTKLLDEITKNITRNESVAQEGEIVAE